MNIYESVEIFEKPEHISAPLCTYMMSIFTIDCRVKIDGKL
jgi:hypothetical protein